MLFRKCLFLVVLIIATSACAANHDDPMNEPTPSSGSPDSQASNTPPDPIPEVQTPTAEDRMVAADKYGYIDPQHVVPTEVLKSALAYYDKNSAAIKNKNYLAVINFAKNSKEKRFFIINMNSGAVLSLHVAHGKGSDPDFDGLATKFSNQSGSNMSSVGYYLTGETYYGDHGYSLRLDGLSSTNSNARSRAIVIHGASYVHESNVIQGRSWGCPAVDMSVRDKVINYLKGKALIYAVK
jgi:hypothetical protein